MLVRNLVPDTIVAPFTLSSDMQKAPQILGPRKYELLLDALKHATCKINSKHIIIYGAWLSLGMCNNRGVLRDTTCADFTS